MSSWIDLRFAPPAAGFAPKRLIAAVRASAVVPIAVASAVLASCAGLNEEVRPAASVPAPAQASLQELMQQSEAATKEGQRDLARTRYREAARIHPTSKVPWQKLAEDYFEAADYGNAILAAQEVLRREPQELMAHSILAVAGLRVSAASLAALRDQRNAVPASTRDEAVSLTRMLREALGEKELVPRPTEAAPALPPAAATRARPAARQGARVPAATAKPAASAPAKPAASKPSNPPGVPQ